MSVVRPPVSLLVSLCITVNPGFNLHVPEVKFRTPQLVGVSDTSHSRSESYTLPFVFVTHLVYERSRPVGTSSHTLEHIF